MKLETIKAGRIVGTHGVRGEVRVQPRDGDPAFLTRFKTFLLEGRPVAPTACRVHKNAVLMKFPGAEDLDAAQALRDKDLYIRRADAGFRRGSSLTTNCWGWTCSTGRPARAWGNWCGWIPIPPTRYIPSAAAGST